MLFAKLFYLVIAIIVTECLSSPTKPISEIPGEDWGYVTVRENAHMFWWLYGAEDESKRDELPLILWLQGGPGASGTGFGNFMEIGPKTMENIPRNTTWIKKANVLFIDNPVGSGYSYVTDNNAFTTNVSGIAEDLFRIFSEILDKHTILQNKPLYIFCESYGGKMTAVFANRLYEGQQRGEIKSNLRGVALGDSWISPTDSVLTWGPYLYQFNLLDQMDLAKVMNISQQTANAVNSGDYAYATELWGDTETVIAKTTDDVNVYNVLQHHVPPDFVTVSEASFTSSKIAQLYRTHVAKYQATSLSSYMNGIVRLKLGIPGNVIWGSQSGDVFKYQSEDFMKPVINYVDKLISYGLKVVVFQGQLDMICDTPGAEKWIQKLKWEGLNNFWNTPRKPIYLSGEEGKTQAFLKTYDNFSLYYIMNAGHMVPADNGEMALLMVDQILNGQ